jgi:peptide/nickel transport system permease protein
VAAIRERKAPYAALYHGVLASPRCATIGRVTAVLRRLALAPLVLITVAVVTYGMPRAMRPEFYRGQGLWSGLWHDLERVFLHFDFGRACAWPGCPAVAEMWKRGMASDVWLLGGTLLLGVGGGVLVGVWCAGRPRSRSARTVETMASVAYCAPVYVVGLWLVLLFNPTVGRWPVPAFFDATPSSAAPWSNPWEWLRTLLVPWTVAALPLAAMCLRLTLGQAREAAQEDYIRTAVAKGLSWRKVMRRHAAPATYVTTASFVAVSVPLVVSNLVLVERVLSVPGFFRHTWRALGHPRDALHDLYQPADVPMLQALTMWGAVLIVVASLLVDVALIWLDPRIREGGR